MRGIRVLLLLLVTGCSGGGPPGLPLRSLSLVTKDQTNMNSGLTVDFVAVYDKALLTKLEGMTASQYFKSIDQMRRDNITMFDVWRWELVPNQILENYDLVFDKKKAWGGLFFADYQTSGDHRINVGQTPYVRVTLGEKDFESVTPEEAPDETEKMVLYPVKETIQLNVRAPANTSAQKTSSQPQAAVGE